MQYIDKPFTSNVHLMSPEHAYMAGRIKTSDLEELRNFQRAFPFNPEIVVDVFKELAAQSADQTSFPGEESRVNAAFMRLLPRCYSPKSVGDWEAVIHFSFTDRDFAYTITVDGQEAKVEKGLTGTATATIAMDYETYRSVLRYEVIEDSKEISSAQLADWERQSQEEALDVELDDEQLEAVAGGKGCGAEASGGTACGADSCGAAAGGAGACGAAACGAAAGAIGVCGAAACGGAVGVGTICGAEACGVAGGAGGACAVAGCGGAAGAGSACGGAACGADACTGAACGAAACSAAACAGAACGADTGFGACAGNACGANVNTFVDFGPCAINVIPCFPFI